LIFFPFRYEQLREDKADIIAYLKRSLEKRSDQILELQARLEGLQRIHVSDTEQSQSQLNLIEQEAARTKEQLLSENMVLSKKLDALEEFRIQRDQLMIKFSEQETKQDNLKTIFERRIEDMGKKHILEEER
jgi:hypothetical protein